MPEKELYVLMISTDRNIFLEGSDAQKRMQEYAALVKELHIIVFTKSGFKELPFAPNARTYPTNSLSRWLYVSGAYFLAKRLFWAGNQSDISLITAQDPFETGLAGFFISRTLRRPLHLQVHTDLFAPTFRRGSFINFLRVPIAKFLFRQSASIRAVSERIKTSILHKMKFAVNRSPRVTVLPVFVDAEKFINTPPSFDLREEYKGFDLLVLVVARLEKEKNVLGALRLLEDTYRAKPNLSVGLVIVGSGSQEKSLRKHAARTGLGGAVFFQGWQSDLVSYYKTADLLLVTSEYEGYGRMFVEAAASGCPVLTRDVGAARDILASWNSIICPEKDRVCLLRNLKNLASDRTLRETLLATARAGVKRIKFPTKEEYLAAYKRMWEEAAENDAFAPLI